MRVSLKSSLGWLVPLAYLALPNCSFPGMPRNFHTGEEPRRGLIFCDIEVPGTRRCATADDLTMGIPLAEAAVALAQRRRSNVGLDYSTAATDFGCAPGQPMAITFKCKFPDGCQTCLNCGEVIGPGKSYPTQDDACVARCLDDFGWYDEVGTLHPNVPPHLGDLLFCGQHARASTKAADTCSDIYLQGACSVEGVPPNEEALDFIDPRRQPEAVQWRDPVGVQASGSTITRTAPPSMEFDAGAASVQTISEADGYVEFRVSQLGRARALGLSVGAATDANPDADPTLAGIGFAIRLSVNDEIFIHESGWQVNSGLNPDGHFGLFAQDDRLRVAVSDNLNGTADIAYYIVPASCAGPTCPTGPPLRTAGPAPYPFRVDASIRHENGTLSSVRLVRLR